VSSAVVVPQQAYVFSASLDEQWAYVALLVVSRKLALLRPRLASGGSGAVIFSAAFAVAIRQAPAPAPAPFASAGKGVVLIIDEKTNVELVSSAPWPGPGG
jgi:hypothetical protein